MALERFIPKSPDPFIRNSQDFEVAKFGHLNTIIEYVNSYVVTDSLQLAGSGPITSTARYITDSLGNSSAISISTTRVGIGTTTPTAQLTVNTTDFVIGANAGYSTYYGSSINGTIQATTSGSTTQLWFRSNGNPLNENDNYWSRIEQLQGGVMRILSSRYGSLVLGNNGYNNAITLYNSAANQMPKVGINNSTPTALLQVTGIGSTSATTSLLVQNSSASPALTITDDKASTFNGNVIIGSSSEIDANSRSLLIYGGYGNTSSDKVLLYLVATNNVGYGVGSKQWIYFGSGQVAQSAKIGGINLGNQNYESGLVFNTTSGGSDTEVMRITNTKNVGINTTNPTAKLQVVGTGSTSATTSLLVQNSAASDMIKTTDDGITTIGNGTSNYFRFDTIGGQPRIVFGQGVDRLSINRSSSNQFIFSQGNVSLTTFARISSGDTEFSDITSYAGTVPSATVVVTSTTKGFLPPRMTTTQKNAIASPAAGLVVYDTDLNKLCVYTTAWQTITSV